MRTQKIAIFVDADACPVKDEVYRVATRQRKADLREQGVAAGGPRPLAAKDRERFLSRLDQWVQAALCERHA